MYKYVNRIKLISFTIISLLVTIISFSSCKQEKTGTIHAQDISKSSVSKSFTKNKGRTIIVYYFHTTFRCYTCTQMEKLTKEVLKKQFRKQIISNKIIFKAVNTEKPGNKHFIQDYQLFTKSVVLVDMRKGKQVNWKRLDKTWNYIRDREAFLRYIKNEIDVFLKGAS